MKMLHSLAILALAAPVGAAPPPDQRRDSVEAFQARKQGRALSIPEIERRVVPTVPGQYLGFDFDSDTTIYTLKFLRNGNIIWVDVDGRSGRVLSRSGR